MNFSFVNATIEWLQRIGLSTKEHRIENINEGIDSELLRQREEKHIWY